MNPVQIYIAIFLGQLIVKGIGDWWYKNKKKKIIPHGVSVAIDGLIYLLAAYFLFCAPEWCSVWFMVGVMFTSGAARWILYDLIYNIVNKEKLNHLGGSSGLDGMLKWFIKKGISQYIIKAIMLGIGINILVWL